jgi:IMP cyclohydrolase
MMTELLDKLRAMAYPGRIILIGLNSKGDRAVVIYSITGRSPSSQARELKLKGNAIWTIPTDEELLKKGNAELLVYSAIAFGRGIAVSNGRQTKDILNQIQEKEDPEEVLTRALNDWTYEPDSPHFTPRISGCILPNSRACLSLIKRGFDGLAQRSFFAWRLEPGKGKLIATYSGKDEQPLPAFQGDPLDLEIKESTPAIMAEAVYTALKPENRDKDFRVAVAAVYAKKSNLRQYEVSIINKRERQGKHG